LRRIDHFNIFLVDDEDVREEVSAYPREMVKKSPTEDDADEEFYFKYNILY